MARSGRLHDLSDQSLGAVLKTALDAVVVMRLDGTIAGWNDVAERTFGWSFDEASGKRMSEMIIPPRLRDAHERGLAHYLATGEGPVLDKHIEIDAVRRDGEEIPVELSITRTSQFGEPVFLGFLRDISERREASRRQELLIGELNHRAKNLLGVVAGIAHQTARASTTIDEFSTAFSGRLGSLGKAHEILTAAVWERSSLGTLVSELLAAYGRGPAPQLTIAGPEVLLSPRQLLSISMIIHELLTNAIKYGALAQADGRIALTWSRVAEMLDFAWEESGVTVSGPPTRRGFGSRMIEISVGHDLRGSSSTEWHPDGMRFTMSFPIDGGSGDVAARSS